MNAAPKVLLVVSLLGVACASKDAHPPYIDTSCDGAACTTLPPVGGKTDTGTDVGAEVSDVGSDAASVSVAGQVRQITAFARDPSLGTAPPTGLTLRALKADGASYATSSIAIDGSFTLYEVGASQKAIVQVLEAATLPKPRTLTVLDTRSPLSGIVLPLFDPALPAVEAARLGLISPTSGTATIVVRFVDAATGTPLAAVTSSTAKPADGEGPFYDDGKDGLQRPTFYPGGSATGTGAQGTVVFLAVSPASAGFSVPIYYAGKTYAPLVPPLVADAITYVVLGL